MDKQITLCITFTKHMILRRDAAIKENPDCSAVKVCAAVFKCRERDITPAHVSALRFSFDNKYTAAAMPKTCIVYDTLVGETA